MLASSQSAMTVVSIGSFGVGPSPSSSVVTGGFPRRQSPSAGHVAVGTGVGVGVSLGRFGVAVKDEGVDGVKSSTAKREAYFIAFAGELRAVARMPVMVTGGFRSKDAMVSALEKQELDVVGLGRPMAVRRS